MNIKCIGCLELHREEMKITSQNLGVYKCSRFPYYAAISGLLHPGKGILAAVADCPEDPLEHCILCPSTEVTHYGDNIVSTCSEHYQAWSKWLDQHPERRAYLHSPHGRAKKANWIEVFREFIEDMRSGGAK